MTFIRYWPLQLFAISLAITCSVYAEHSRPSPEVILLYGTSCAGKSTLAHTLQQELKHSWEILDWDDYAEEFGDDLASELLTNDLMQLLINDKHIIIDAQTCLELENTLLNYDVKTVLVYAPLKTLISRDDARNALSKRPERRRRYARAYIYETFFQLYGIDSTHDFVDKIDPTDVQPDLIQYPLKEKTYDFFQKIVQSSVVVPIYAKRKYDLIINTERSNLNSSVREIQSKWFDFDESVEIEDPQCCAQ
jgi:chloramphenicol 3-O-phosphotransferase